MACATCRSPLEPTQEYCLRCGARRAGAGRLGRLPAPGGRRVLRRALLLLLVAAGGALGAILMTRESTAAPAVRRALGGNVPAQLSDGSGSTLAQWPRRNGWTIALVSIPKRGGKNEALAVAEAARARSLPRVGILDSSRYASLHPGFWLVFTGYYASEPEATGSLRAARALVKTARVQRIAR